MLWLTCFSSTEFEEEPRASVEETDTHSVVNIDIQVTDGSKEIDVISEEALKPIIETAAKPVILTKTALKKIVTGKTASKRAKKHKAMASSESQTTTLQQQQNQATTNKQQHTSAEGHVHSTQETAASAFLKNMTQELTMLMKHWKMTIREICHVALIRMRTRLQWGSKEIQKLNMNMTVIIIQ